MHRHIGAQDILVTGITFLSSAGLFLLLFLLFVALYLLVRCFSRDRLGLMGFVIWADTADKKAFFNTKYKILGKPDFIYRMPPFFRPVIVELKSRSGPVYDSDIAQVTAACLAARGSGIIATKAVIITRTSRMVITLPRSQKKLHSRIRQHANTIRSIKASGISCRTDDKRKCAGCGFRKTCMG
ncbi:hypothetical protein A3709_20140 [Halioglobus sp. HI00S01]|nr:hypothetical protein A3709_20140 [Halioglobus sp. HI00S01]